MNEQKLKMSPNWTGETNFVLFLLLTHGPAPLLVCVCVPHTDTFPPFSSVQTSVKVPDINGGPELNIPHRGGTGEHSPKLLGMRSPAGSRVLLTPSINAGFNKGHTYQMVSHETLKRHRRCSPSNGFDAHRFGKSQSGSSLAKEKLKVVLLSQQKSDCYI